MRRILTLASFIFLASSLVAQSFPGFDESGMDDHLSVCNLDRFNASCRDGSVVLMVSAKFGRMRIGKCVTRKLGYLGCHSLVLPVMDSFCSGRVNCSVPIPNRQLQKDNPCPKDTTPYLHATYQCVPVAMASRAECVSRRVLQVNASALGGYISSLPAQHDELGTSRCPWRLVAPEGRKIRISVFDLHSEDDATRQDICYEFASVREDKSSRRLTKCASNERLRFVYESSQRQVDLQFASRKILATLGVFLLRYEVVGCATPPPPKHGWLRRRGNALEVHCNVSQSVRRVHCNVDAWDRAVGNCSLPERAPSWGIGALLASEEHFPYGILLVVAIGVALGVFCGGLLLTIAAVRMKRKRPDRQTMPLPPPPDGASLNKPEVWEENTDNRHGDVYVRTSHVVYGARVPGDVTYDDECIVPLTGQRHFYERPQSAR